jgi:hypothetical protein
MCYKRALEENHDKAEKQTSKQVACEETKYNINSIIIITITENRSIITVLTVIIIIKIIEG